MIGVILGDSTIYTRSNPDQLGIDYFLLNDSRYVSYNIADGGDTINDQLTVWDTLSSANKLLYDWVIIQIGLNDMNPAESAEAAMTRYQNLVDNIVADTKVGCKIIISSMLLARQRYIDKYGAVNGEIAYKKELSMNESIMGNGNFPVTGVDFRIDYHVDKLSTDGYLLPQYDIGEGIHENNEGRRIIATGWVIALKSLGVFSDRKAYLYYTKLNKGSILDRVSSTLPILTNEKFVENARGKALRQLDSTSRINTGLSHSEIDLTGNISIVIKFKIGNDYDFTGSVVGGRLVYNGTFLVSLDRGFGVANSILISSNIASGFKNSSSNVIEPNKEYVLVILRKANGICSMYLNNVLIMDEVATYIPAAGTSDLHFGHNVINDLFTFNGEFYETTIYNTLLTEQERNAEYANFLNSYNLSEAKRNIGGTFNLPTNLSNETGLIAAYNANPINIQNGTLIDVSQNGHNGTINGALLCEEGMRFDGVDDFVNIDTVVGDLGSTTQGSILLRAAPVDSTPGVEEVFIAFGDNNANENIALIIQSDGTLRAVAAKAGVGQWGLDTDSKVFNDNKFFQIALVHDGSAPVLYVDGTAPSQTFSVETDKTAWFNALTGIDNGRIGNRNYNSTGENLFFAGEIEDVRIYNRAISTQEVKDYHNYWARQIEFKDNFEYDNADGNNITPREWGKGTGTYKISEATAQDSVLKDFDIGTKSLVCTSAGTIHIQQEAAYGTWEFDAYKGANVNAIIMGFIKDNNGSAATSGNGYYFAINVNEAIVIGKVSSGSPVAILFTSNGYVQNNTRYRIKITRTTGGEFTVYIKGGFFGDTYTLVDVTGEGGSNPLIDNTYKTSKYLVVDNDTGDEISRINIRKGILQ